MLSEVSGQRNVDRPPSAFENFKSKAATRERDETRLLRSGSSGMSKGDQYRARAAAIIKAAKNRTRNSGRPALEKKAKALLDMAENEDWLEGKPATKKVPEAVKKKRVRRGADASK